jgi:coenzyme F420-reducing hydrogenase delta subunit
VAFVCGESAGRALSVDEAEGTCGELPGYRVMRVPCVGWVHALTVERAIRHGAGGVLLVACGPGSQMYREGASWTAARMTGARVPMLNGAKVDPTSVRVVGLYRGDVRRLSREAISFRESRGESSSGQSRAAVATAGAGLALVFGALVVSGSRVGYALPRDEGPELVVSFKHPGVTEQRCRQRTPEELQKLPLHMRQPQVCERGRVWVRLRASVDGARIVDKKYEPKGLWDDGNSLALERLPVSPGSHLVRVEIGDTGDEADWGHVEERTLDFERRGAHVVTFDKVDGFRWR